MSDGDLFSLGGEGSLSDFVLSTVISRQRKSLSVFLSRRKKNGRKRKTAQGVPPLREFILSSLSRDENMNSRRLHPPRPPNERVRPVAAAPEMECTAENVPYSEQNPFAQLLARHDSAALPLSLSPTNNSFPSTLLCYFLSKKVDVSFLLPATTVIAAAAAITAAAMQRIAAASGFFAGSFS